MNEEEFYVRADRDPNYRGDDKLKIERHSLSCWSVDPFSVCVESWQNNQLRLGLYISQLKVATVTLTANDPCYLLEEGDFIKVKANTCADFTNRRVTTEGYVRIAGERINFRQVIFTW